jgi:hypothetical protein
VRPSPIFKLAYPGTPWLPADKQIWDPILSGQNSPHLYCRPFPASGSRDATIVQDCCNLPQRISSIAMHLTDHWGQISGPFSSSSFTDCDAGLCASEALRPICDVGFPKRVPRALAAARAALVRDEIMTASCSATAARI